MTGSLVERQFCYAVRAMLRPYLMVGFAVVALAQDNGALRRIADCVRQGSFEEAVKLADSELHAHVGDKRILTLRAIALEKLNQNVAAIDSYRLALRLDPGYIPALRGTAELEFRLGDRRAAGDIDHLLTSSPNDQTAHAMRGVLAWREKDCAAAARHFAAAGPLLDSQPAALHEYGVCLVRQNRHAEALAVFERLQKQQLGDRRSACVVASLQLQLHRNKEAVEALGPLAEAEATSTVRLLQFV
jgi:Tfp pilus assembly protein PilF